MKLLCHLALLLMLWCNISLAQNNDVVVLPKQVAAPDGAQKLGRIKMGNNSTSMHCDYEELVRDAKEKARAMHGNVVKITKLIEPSFIGKCYKIEADVYLASDISQYKAGIAVSKNLTPANSNYAIVYLYRLRDTLATLTSYNVHLNNDSVVYCAKRRSADSVRLYKEGTITLWGETDKRTELKINVKFGETYYVRCGLIKGEIRMYPVLELADNDLGSDEYHKITRGKQNMAVSYLNQVH